MSTILWRDILRFLRSQPRTKTPPFPGPHGPWAGDFCGCGRRRTRFSVPSGPIHALICRACARPARCLAARIRCAAPRSWKELVRLAPHAHVVTLYGSWRDGRPVSACSYGMLAMFCGRGAAVRATGRRAILSSTVLITSGFAKSRPATSRVQRPREPADAGRVARETVLSAETQRPLSAPLRFPQYAVSTNLLARERSSTRHGRPNGSCTVGVPELRC